MRASEPVCAGFVERDGVKLHWQEFGAGEPTILLLPTWSIIDSRFWKAQVPYLSRHFRVVTFDGRGDFRRETDVLAHAVTARRPGERVAVTVRRGGQTLDLTLPMQE